MTIGIGGWGSRRKPMSIVRAILRSDLRDLTIVAYGGPDVGMLCAAGKARKVVYGFVSLDSIPLEPHFRAARQQATDRGDGARRGDAPARPAGRGVARVVPAVPRRARLGDPGGEPGPAHRDVAVRRAGARRDAGAAPRRRPPARQPGRRTRRRAVPRSRLVLRRPLRHGRGPDVRVVRTGRRRPRTSPRRARSSRSGSAASSPTASWRHRSVPTSRTASPTTTATSDSSGSTPRRRRIPTRGRRSAPRTSTSRRPTTAVSPRHR